MSDLVKNCIGDKPNFFFNNNAVFKAGRGMPYRRMKRFRFKRQFLHNV